MSTPQPPVNGDDQTPAEGTTPAPAKRAPSRSTPSAARKPVTGVRKAPTPAAGDKPVAAASAKATAAKPATAKPATAKPATAKPATANPANAKPATTKPATTKPATRRTTTTKPAATPKPDEQGDVPSILETALAGHNASVRASVDAVESSPAEPVAAPDATKAQAAAVADMTVATPPTDDGATTPAVIPVGVPETVPAPDATAVLAPETPEPTAPTEPVAAEDAAQTAEDAAQTQEGAIPQSEAPSATAAPDGTVPPAGYRSVTDFADRLDDTRFFSSLFDFTFTNYVTRKLAGPVYVVGLVLIGLSTLLSIIYSLTLAIGTHSFLGAFVFLFGVIITLVGAILSVLLLRVGIEVFVAIIEIAQNTRGRKKERR
ncbi:DUF4282 domain-containing protein [Leifsonia poae]|uniref:DUF4282 domain-containing protein n=1 Tax=Leifsonia poae TaxID=110933 RepID=UPI003D667341